MLGANELLYSENVCNNIHFTWYKLLDTHQQQDARQKQIEVHQFEQTQIAVATAVLRTYV